MKELNDRVISLEQYLFLIDNGNTYEGHVEGVGYAISGVTVVKQRFNKYNHHFTRLAFTNTLVEDNSAIEKAKEVSESIRINQQIEETKRDLLRAVDDYYAKEILKDFDLLNGKDKRALIESQKAILIGKIHNQHMPITKDDFPPIVYAERREQVNRFVNWRNQGSVVSLPSQERVSQGRSVHEQFMYESNQMHPISTPIASNPAIQMSLLAALSGGGSITIPLSKEAFKVSFTMGSAYKATSSIIGQSLASPDGLRGVNLIGVAGDAFLHPGAGAVLGNFIELRPWDYDKKVFQLTGYNKPLNQFASDALISYGFGKIGGGEMNRLQSFLTTSEQRLFHNIFWNSWLYFGTYQSTEKVKKDKVFEEMIENLKRQLENDKNFYR